MSGFQPGVISLSWLRVDLAGRPVKVDRIAQWRETRGRLTRLEQVEVAGREATTIFIPSVLGCVGLVAVRRAGADKILTSSLIDKVLIDTICENDSI